MCVVLAANTSRLYNDVWYAYYMHKSLHLGKDAFPDRYTFPVITVTQYNVNRDAHTLSIIYNVMYSPMCSVPFQGIYTCTISYVKH